MASPFARLYADAIVESERAAQHARDLEAEEAAHLTQRIKDAQDALLDDVLNAAPQKIMDAASSGVKATPLLAFNGAETYQDLNLVFLVRGPRPGVASAAGHIDPLIHRLQHALAPFVVRHEWDAATGGNRVMASWKE